MPARPLTASRYPKHVWSPAGGWYAQPGNWKGNTAVVGAVLVSIVGFAWTISAQREFRHKMPEQGRFFPSRLYVTPDREEKAPPGCRIHC